MRGWGLLSVSSILLFSLSVANAQEKEFDPYAVRPPNYIEYKRLPYADLLNKSELEQILQRFVDQVWGKGFIYIGDERDFHHGHFLFHKREVRPIAILWHTQERVGDPYYGPMEYVDRWGRNWVQFLDNHGRIANAFDFVDLEKWKTYDPGEKRFHTVGEKVLDIDGEVVTKIPLGIHFRRIRCERTPPETNEELNRIEIVLPNDEIACLLLVSNYCARYLPRVKRECEYQKPALPYALSSSN